MSEPSADDLTKRLFVCCGYVTLESGKPGIAIAEVMAEPVEPSDETASQFHIPGTGDLARLRIHERKLLRHLSVGSTYAVEANETSIRPSTARWQGRYHNDEVVRTWQAMADAHEIAERARKAEAAEKRRDLKFEALEPIPAGVVPDQWPRTACTGGPVIGLSPNAESQVSTRRR